METLSSYFEALASAQPTPGGGSAATVVAACGAALVGMTARVTLANPKHAGRHEAAQSLAAQADALHALLLAGRRVDEAAYGNVVQALALPRETTEQKDARSAYLQTALAQAAGAPLEAASLSLQVLELAEQCLQLENINLISDVGCAAQFAAAALAAAAYNVRINHKFLKDPTLIARQQADLLALTQRAKPILNGIHAAVNRLLPP